MATSGTTAFDLDFLDIIEDAYERAGLEARSGYDMRTARRSVNLMITEWANRGINLWTMVERTLPLQAGVHEYPLDSDLVDLVYQMIRLPAGVGTTRQQDYNLTRISVITYAQRTSKLTESRPTEIYVDRQRVAPVIKLWPVPNIDGYQMVYWALRRMDDAGAYTNTADVPFRFLEPFIAGLASRIANKNPTKVPKDLRDTLAASAEQAFALAALEDRDKSTLKIVPLRRFNL